MRKYTTEFGLNIHTSHRTIIPVENLDSVEQDKDYHLYFILSCPRYIIQPDSIQSDPNGISIVLETTDKNSDNNIHLTNIKLLKDIDYTKIKLTSVSPYYLLKVEFEDLIEIGSKGQKTDVLYIDSHHLLFNYLDHSNFDFNVQYIGQSYGNDGNRNAIQRLSSHSTLQKILTEFSAYKPQERLYILLIETTEYLMSMIDGISDQFQMSDEEDDKHIEEVYSNLPERKQIINITEAALINYFKPIYNTNFVNNFPNDNHKGYRQYYDLDYNQIQIELDTNFDGFINVNLLNPEKELNNGYRIIKYNLNNENTRDDMFKIFNLP